MYEFDFDVAWTAFENSKGEPLPGEYEIRKLAKKHNVEITKINYVGPGGGNPNIFARAPNRQKAGEFLYDVYNCKTQQEFEDYCEPALPPE